MSADNAAPAAPGESPDKMADEWAAAMAEAKPADGGALAAPAESPAPFASFASGATVGRTRIPIKHILQLAQGSVVELETMAGEPMDVLVNGYLIAQGEVVVVNDRFGIRLTDIVTPSERMRRLSKGG